MAPQDRARVEKEEPSILWQDGHVAVILKGPHWICAVSRNLDENRSIRRQLPADITFREVVNSGKSEHLVHYVISKWKDDRNFALSNSVEHEFGLAHRLDVETSGCLLLGKTLEGFNFLRESFLKRDVYKEYICLCHGLVKETTSEIELPIAWDESKNISYINKEKGQWAKSIYTVLGRYRLRGKSKVFTLCRVVIITGRTHQIRLHMASIGHPLVSDNKYNYTLAKTDVMWCPRLFLHAWRIGFNSFQHEWQEVKAPLVPDLTRALRMLEEIKVDPASLGGDAANPSCRPIRVMPASDVSKVKQEPAPPPPPPLPGANTWWNVPGRRAEKRGQPVVKLPGGAVLLVPDYAPPPPPPVPSDVKPTSGLDEDDWSAPASAQPNPFGPPPRGLAPAPPAGPPPALPADQSPTAAKAKKGPKAEPKKGASAAEQSALEEELCSVAMSLVLDAPKCQLSVGQLGGKQELLHILKKFGKTRPKLSKLLRERPDTFTLIGTGEIFVTLSQSAMATGRLKQVARLGEKADSSMADATRKANKEREKLKDDEASKRKSPAAAQHGAAGQREEASDEEEFEANDEEDFMAAALAASQREEEDRKRQQDLEEQAFEAALLQSLQASGEDAEWQTVDGHAEQDEDAEDEEDDEDRQLREALELSQQAEEERLRMLQREEEEFELALRESKRMAQLFYHGGNEAFEETLRLSLLESQGSSSASGSSSPSPAQLEEDARLMEALQISYNDTYGNGFFVDDDGDDDEEVLYSSAPPSSSSQSHPSASAWLQAEDAQPQQSASAWLQADCPQGQPSASAWLQADDTKSHPSASSDSAPMGGDFLSHAQAGGESMFVDEEEEEEEETADSRGFGKWFSRSAASKAASPVGSKPTSPVAPATVASPSGSCIIAEPVSSPTSKGSAGVQPASLREWAMARMDALNIDFDKETLWCVISEMDEDALSDEEAIKMWLGFGSEESLPHSLTKLLAEVRQQRLIIQYAR